METLGKLLRNRRQEAGMTLAEVAERGGFSQSSLSMWERGHTVPQPTQRRALADALDLSLSAVLDAIRADEVPARPASSFQGASSGQAATPPGTDIARLRNDDSTAEARREAIS